MVWFLGEYPLWLSLVVCYSDHNLCRWQFTEKKFPSVQCKTSSSAKITIYECEAFKIENLIMKALSENSYYNRKSLISQQIMMSSGILHLGAHLGQEAQTYADADKPVVWVEAMPDIHNALTKRLENFPNQRALCALLGNEDGLDKTFHVSNNGKGQSSSIFCFGEYGNGDSTLWPELDLDMVETLNLKTVRLDKLLVENRIEPRSFDFWIVDLQGAELIALQGAGDYLSDCRALLVEVSEVDVYKGGVRWHELRPFIEAAGFNILWEPELPHDDVLFVRKDAFMAELYGTFHADEYLTHNQKRLEHLDSLGLDLMGKQVLEVGAGIGDLTEFYLRRDCSVLTSDARPENLSLLHERFGHLEDVKVSHLDMDYPIDIEMEFDIIHCYGLLYHLKNPLPAIEFMARHCKGLLLVETCVSNEKGSGVNQVSEPLDNYSQALHGYGCRPDRSWLWHQLKEHIPYVYATKTQPDHPEFPLDWDASSKEGNSLLKRAVFVGSFDPIEQNENLLIELPDQYLPLK